MKKLNLPLLIALVVGSMVTVVGIHLLHGYQVSRNADNLLVRAEDAAKAGDVEEQMRLLSRYLRHRNDDVENLKKLLKLSREEAFSTESPNAIRMVLGSLEKAIRRYPEDADLRREGYQAFLAVGRFSDALDHLEALRGIDDQQNNQVLTGEDRVQWARVLWLNNSQAEGRRQLAEMIGYDEITKSFPETPDKAPTASNEISAYSLLAGMYQRDLGSDEGITIARTIMDRCVEQNPESVDAYLARALFLQRNDEITNGGELAEPDVRKALELDPEDQRVILVAATTAMEIRNFSWAEQLLRDGMAKHPESVSMQSRLADARKAQGDTAGAREIVDTALDKFKLNGDLLFKRASYEIDLNNLAAAEQTIDRLTERKFDPMRVEILRARVEMAKGSFANAEVRLKRLQPLVANDSVLRGAVSDYLTVCLTKTGRIDEIPRFAGVTEDNLRITYAQADAFVALGKYREALEIYEDIFQNHQGDLSDDGKREIPRKILDVHIRLQRSLPVAQRNWDQVNAMAKSILNGNMLNPAEKELFQIQLLERQERMDEARNLAERATQKFPEIRQFPLIVAELTPDHEQALKILDRLEQSGGDSPVLRIARGNRLAQQRPPELEQQLLGLLDGADKFDDESLILKQNIATLLRRSGFPMSAFTIWEGLLPSVQNRTGTLLLMFEIAEEAASLESMDKVMELLAQEPTGKNAAEWLVCEANRQLWLVETKQRSADDLSDIVRLLDKAKAERPEYAPIFAMEAEINVLQGKLPQAIELLETASRNRPGEIAYQQRLADLYVKSGRSDDARRILQQLPDSQKRTADVINEINSLLQQNPQLAVQRALDLFSEDSKKPEELMLLADVFRAVGETDRALPVIQRALKADMTQARPWLLFVQTLVAKGRTEDARKAVEELKKHVPADQQPLLLGQCYSTIRDFDSAEKSLSDAIATRPNDTVIMRNLALLYAAQQKNAELTKILEQMIAVTNAGDAESSRNVAWARRFLAQQLAATQSYGDFERARDLVEQNKDRNGALQGEDLALWLKIHAERPEAESRKKAVARLEELSRTRSLSANEDFIRAYIHYVEGKWPDARSLMPTVISKADGNTQFVVTFIEWLLEKNEVNDAKRWIGSLDQRSLQAIRFNAALMIKDGRASDAAKAIMARVPKEIDRPTAVALLEDLGKYHPGFYAAASQQWKLIVKESPNQVSAYIGYLTRIPQGEGVGEMMQLLQPRFDEAIQKKDAATAIYCINTAITALRNNRKDIPTSSPHYARVGQWMDAAKAAKFDPNVLVWSEVDFYDLQQQYEQLVTIYQDLLKRKDLTELQLAVIRNNLAFLYAISNQGERALEVIGDAISQLGPRSDFLDTRGLAHLSSGNVEAAVADLRKAVEGGQGDGSTFFHLALAESKSGNVPEAVAAIQEAIGKGLTEEQLSKPEATLFRNLMKELQPHLPAESVE